MEIVATTNELGFDASQFVVNGCTINPAIGAGTLPNKTLSEMTMGPGDERVSISGMTPATIPDGLLYTCAVHIGGAVAPGTSMLTNTASAADPAGNPVAVTGSPGHVVVTLCTGDCDGNGTVTIGEVTKCINLFLGQPLCNVTIPASSCPAADSNGDGTVSIGEVTHCVNRFLGGC